MEDFGVDQIGNVNRFFRREKHTYRWLKRLARRSSRAIEQLQLRATERKFF